MSLEPETTVTASVLALEGFFGRVAALSDGCALGATVSFFQVAVDGVTWTLPAASLPLTQSA